MAPIRSRFILRFAVLLLSSLIAVAGCSSTEERPVEPPDLVLKRGLGALRAGNYIDAQEEFNHLLSDSPNSKERIPALRLLADAHYMDEEYEEAKFHYQKFAELYPVHKFTEHALYYKAMSDYKLIDNEARDQTYSQNALEEFDYLIKAYPKGKYYKKSLKKKTACLKMLAENLFFIGRFYYRTGGYHSAITRLKTLLKEYPNQNFLDEAVFLIGESYLMEENSKTAIEYYTKLIKNYPDSSYVSDAQDRLDDLK